MVISNIYVSHGVEFFKDNMKKKFNLNDYNKNCLLPTAFFGMYNMDDLKELLYFKGRKIFIPGGSDVNSNIIFKQNIALIKKQRIPIFCQSQYLYDNCILIYPSEYVKLIPLTPSIINDFYEPTNIKGDHIYIYTANNDISAKKTYGKDIYTRIIDKLKHKYKFILGHSSKYKDIKDIYKKCFIGLRLTKQDGLGATNIELGLMGIKCVTNNISPNCLHWNNDTDIINHIFNEAKNISKSDSDLSIKTKTFIDNEKTIFN